MAYNLASVETIPVPLREDLTSQEEIFQETELLEELLERRSLRTAAEELNALCEADGVIGYHYTRSFRNRITTEGLVACSGDQHRRRFLREYGDRFTPSQRQRLLQSWENYFDSQQNRARDGRVWFNLTLNALGSSGARPLLYHFGGEVIYMPVKRDDEIAEILHSIGNPLVVKCALDTDNLTTFADLPWGKVWLSTYHRCVNPSSYRFDVDAYCTSSILPNCIIGIQRVSSNRL